MRAAAKPRAAGTTAAILTLALCAAATSAALSPVLVSAAFAQATVPGPDGTPLPVVTITQVQLGDVFAGQTVDVVNGDPVVAQATAAGNTVSSITSDPGQNYVGSQTLSGNISADALARVSRGAGSLLQSAASAVGDSSTVGSCCGTAQGVSTQTFDASSSVSSEAEVYGQGPTAAQVSADATAVGNTQGYESDGAGIGTQTNQRASGPIDAQTVAVVGGVDGESGYTATSVANDVEATSNSGLVAVVTRQTADATAPSSATLTVQQDGGDTILAQSTATGNNVNAVNGGYTVSLDSQQTNAGDTTADATVGIGGWNSASVGAYGVGNSINAESGGGGQTLLNTSQTNSGAITAQAQLTGGTGGDTYVNATAVGNALQAACNGCAGGVSGETQQTNAGRVTSVGRIAGTTGGSIVGASSAIGNTATYTVKSGG